MKMVEMNVENCCTCRLYILVFWKGLNELYLYFVTHFMVNVYETIGAVMLQPVGKTK
jgi:hypothetical protein